MIKVSRISTTKQSRVEQVVQLMRSNGHYESSFLCMIDAGVITYSIAGAMCEVYRQSLGNGEWVRMQSWNKSAHGFSVGGVLLSNIPHNRVRTYFFGPSHGSNHHRFVNEARLSTSTESSVSAFLRAVEYGARRSRS